VGRGVVGAGGPEAGARLFVSAGRVAGAAAKGLPLLDIETVLPPSLGRHVRSHAIAEALGVSTETVRQWALRGVIPPPARITGRLHLYSREDTVAALRRRAEGGAR